MLDQDTIDSILVAVRSVPQLRGSVVGLYDGERCMVISSGAPGAALSSRLSVIVEVIWSEDQAEIAQLEGRVRASNGSSSAPPPAVILNKSRMAAEITGAGWNCVMTGVAAVGLAAGVASEVPSAGASTFLVVAAWVGLGTSAVQCMNGLVRVAEIGLNPSSNSLEQWDNDKTYSTLFLLVDALGVISGLSSLPFAWQNLWAVLSRQRAFAARGITLAKLKEMNRFARFKLIKEVFDEAAKTPEARAALQKAAAEAQISATSLERTTMSVRQSVAMAHVISKETQRRLINSLVGVLSTVGGAGMSATPGRWSGSASGSVNWVINLVDSG